MKDRCKARQNCIGSSRRGRAQGDIKKLTCYARVASLQIPPVPAYAHVHLQGDGQGVDFFHVLAN